MRPVLLVLMVAGCQRVSWFNRAADDPDPGYPVDDPFYCPPDSQVTWHNHAKPVIDTWCATCHTSMLTGADRQGAMEGLNFDTYQGVAPWADRIRLAATGDKPFMPPAGGVPDIDRERLREWINCGAKGEPDTAAFCATLVVQEGSVIWSGQADADALCASGFNAIAGDLTVTGELAIECLCDIDGNLTIAGAATAVSIGALLDVGGEVTMVDNASLATVDLPKLESTGGVTVSGNPMLSAVAWSALVHIEGSLTVSGNPALTDLDLQRLRFIEGDMTLDDNASLATLASTASLERIAGKLTATNLPMLGGLGGFLSIEEQLGDIEIAYNDGLVGIDGFTALYALSADILIHDNPSLKTLSGFQHLEQMHGDLRVYDNPVLERINGGFVNLATMDGAISLMDCPELVDINGFEIVNDLGSLVLIDLPALVDPADFGTVSVAGPVTIVNSGVVTLDLLKNATAIGGVRVEDNSALVVISGFDTVTMVDGDLSIRNNASLVDLPAFDSLTDVSGDFAMVDNPLLQQLRDVVVLANVGGSLRIVDNLALFEIAQLETLQSVGNDVVITGNIALPTSEANTVANNIGSVGGAITVSGNGPG